MIHVHRFAFGEMSREIISRLSQGERRRLRRWAKRSPAAEHRTDWSAFLDPHDEWCPEVMRFGIRESKTDDLLVDQFPDDPDRDDWCTCNKDDCDACGGWRMPPLATMRDVLVQS